MASCAALTLWAASIARPFAGASGAYERTKRRRDFSLEPPRPTYLDLLHERGVPVVGVGKIGKIFTQRGVDVDDHTTDNTAGIAACTRHLTGMSGGLLFANLVDFDQVWGHRNDVAGFAQGLAAVDAAVAEWLTLLRAGDVMLLCADHGVDPTTVSTDRLARVLAAARPRPCTGTLRRRPGGRGRHGVRAPHRRGAAAAGPGDLLMTAAAGAMGRVAAFGRHAAVVFGSGLAALPPDAVVADEVGYDELGWPVTAVTGHGSVLRLVRLAGEGSPGLRLALACGRPRTATRAGRRRSWSVRYAVWPPPACRTSS